MTRRRRRAVADEDVQSAVNAFRQYATGSLARLELLGGRSRPFTVAVDQPALTESHGSAIRAWAQDWAADDPGAFVAAVNAALADRAAAVT